MTSPSGFNIDDFSTAMANAVERAAASTVLVDARRKFPASGIVFAPGLVLTADHVVERDEEIFVGLPDGGRHAAVLAGRDPGNDLAVLRVEGASLSVAETASPPRIGQLALALGRPSEEGIQSSLGVVSAIGGPVRTRRGVLLEQTLRTDATPYPGFSGGPLIDLGGRVLGLNTSGLSRFASLTIPVASAWPAAQALAEHGHVRRGYLGVRSQPVELTAAMREALGRDQFSGLLLVNVEPDSPAARGGLQVGDILTGMGGNPITDPDELLVRLSGAAVGQPVATEILRGGQRTTLQVTIGERKEG